MVYVLTNVCKSPNVKHLVNFYCNLYIAITTLSQYLASQPSLAGNIRCYLVLGGRHVYKVLYQNNHNILSHWCEYPPSDNIASCCVVNRWENPELQSRHRYFCCSMQHCHCEPRTNVWVGMDKSHRRLILSNQFAISILQWICGTLSITRVL